MGTPLTPAAIRAHHHVAEELRRVRGLSKSWCRCLDRRRDPETTVWRVRPADARDRIIRDIGRKIDDDEELQEIFAL